MRVSEIYRLNHQQRYLDTISQRMDRVQQELATGRRVSRASDDPAGAVLALEHRSDIAFEAQMRRNMDNGTAFLNVTETALDGATDILQRVRELTVQAASDTQSSSGRRAVAQEVNQLIDHLAQIGNGQFAGAYIFSGQMTKTPAYQVTGSPLPTAITFMGDTGDRVTRISEQATVATNVAGSTAFGSIFADLIALRDDLNLNAPGATISAHLSAIDSGLDRVLAARADVGSRVNRFEATQRTSEQTDTNLQQLRAGIEEVDIANAVTRLTAEQTSYQAALGAIGRTSNMSLMDYMR
jgi:flagellar hook-associated protein 3 FlgL